MLAATVLAALAPPGAAYTPPPRTRRAADEARFQMAKERADASNGRTVLCKMSLIVEMQYTGGNAEAVEAVLCENQNKAQADLYIPTDMSRISTESIAATNRWISVNLDSLPPQAVVPQSRLGGRHSKAKSASEVESDKLKVLNMDALDLATVVVDEPQHIPRAHSAPAASVTPKGSKSGGNGQATMSRGKGKGTGMGKRGRRNNADPVEQTSDEGTLPAEQVVGHGDRDVLIMRVNYAGEEPSYCDEDCVKDNMWRSSPSVDSLYHDVSFGNLRFPEGMGSVITVDVPNGLYASSGCKFWEIGLEADAAARAVGIEPDDYSHRTYLLPQSTGGCTFGGLGYVGCSSTYCKTWIRQQAGGTLAHELGHNLGVWHSATDSNNDGIQENEYGDNSDVMGSTTNWRGMNAVHRDELNWFPEAATVTYDEEDMTCQSNTETTLVSLSRDVDPPTGPSLVTFPRLAPGLGTYHLSLRTGTGVDASLADEWRDKVFVHYHQMHSTRYQVNSQLVKTMEAGDIFTDSVTGVTIIVVAIDTNTDTATIQYNFCEQGETPADREGPAPPPAPTSAPTDPACSESAPDKCEIWRDSGFCDPEGIYYNYMSINCRVACGLCTPPTTAPTPSPPTPPPTKSTKDGYAFIDDSEARPLVQCVELTPYQAMPQCVVGGIPCCNGTICAPLRHQTAQDWRCVVPRGARRPDGAQCTFNGNCQGACDKRTWTCTSTDRSRRSDSLTGTLASVASGNMPAASFMLLCALLLTAAIGIHRTLQHFGGDENIDPAVEAATNPEPRPQVHSSTVTESHPLLRPKVSTSPPLLSLRSRTSMYAGGSNPELLDNGTVHDRR